ncbi:MAG TPA: alpha/beta hydrolase [Planctomycetota bacterium]|nr:alpha/beta hydrolase [Planctomycetota bacterium]
MSSVFVTTGCRVVEAPARGTGESVRIPVFFGTDRQPTGRGTPSKYFGAERGDPHRGVCEVSVPRDHRMGEYEIRWGRRGDPSTPDTHVLLLSLKTLAADPFRLELSREAGGKPVFVYIHGYNTTFDDAIRRTAQLAYDLGFDGTPLCWSWASEGNILEYLKDERAVEKTVAPLRQFLLDVIEQSGATAVHLIAHSMGNRALLGALEKVEGRRFGEVVHAAPDVDADEFARRVVWTSQTARRTTLYASSRDYALQASKTVHLGPRAGDSGEGILVVPMIDSIDVSAVDTSLLGHSYYGDCTSVVCDLGVLLRERTPVERRPNLELRTKPEGRWWVFKPGP